MLSAMIFLPLAAALLVLFLPGGDETKARNARYVALGTTLILPNESEPLYDAEEIIAALGNQLTAIVDGGPCPHMPTTVVDLTTMSGGGDAVLLRQGAGDAAILGL